MNSTFAKLAALALTCTAAASANAAGSAVNTMGDPVYFAASQNFTLVGGLANSASASSFDTD